MAKEMLPVLFAIVLAALLLPGCTMNPQDLSRQAPAGAGSSGTVLGGSAQPGTPNASISQLQGILLTMEEVAKHSTASDCWMVIHGIVLDLTSFSSHPGGSAYIPYCGKDGTLAYESAPHSAAADSMFQYYRIGLLGQAAEPNTNTLQPATPGGAHEYGGDGDD